VGLNVDTTADFFLFLSARRSASAGSGYGPLYVCLSVCLSVTSRSSIDTSERVGLLLGRGFDLRPILQCVIKKFGYLKK